MKNCALHWVSLALLFILLIATVDLKPTENELQEKPIICPADFVPLGDSCYYFSSDATNWTNALINCAKKISHLATIKSADENKLVQNYMRENIIVPGLEGWWIGGLRVPVENFDWLWVHTLNKISYKDWCPGEPNDYEIENCLSLNPNCDFNWNDRSCDYWAFRYICEMDPYGGDCAESS